MLFVLLIFLIGEPLQTDKEILLPPGVIIYSQPEINSIKKIRTIDTLRVKTLYEVFTADSLEWIYIELPDGSRGFVPKKQGWVTTGDSSYTTTQMKPQTRDPCLQAKLDAQQDVEEGLWLGVGFLFGVFGVVGSYLIVPDPPVDRLVGKSSEYIKIYLKCHKATVRTKQLENASAGCVLGVVTLFVINSMLSH